jgi:hypothetical protein
MNTDRNIGIPVGPYSRQSRNVAGKPFAVCRLINVCVVFNESDGNVEGVCYHGCASWMCECNFLVRAEGYCRKDFWGIGIR